VNGIACGRRCRMSGIIGCHASSSLPSKSVMMASKQIRSGFNRSTSSRSHRCPSGVFNADRCRRPMRESNRFSKACRHSGRSSRAIRE
jgi:hypothetical protein